MGTRCTCRSILRHTICSAASFTLTRRRLTLQWHLLRSASSRRWRRHTSAAVSRSARRLAWRSSTRGTARSPLHHRPRTSTTVMCSRRRRGRTSRCLLPSRQCHGRGARRSRRRRSRDMVERPRALVVARGRRRVDRRCHRRSLQRLLLTRRRLRRSSTRKSPRRPRKCVRNSSRCARNSRSTRACGRHGEAAAGEAISPTRGRRV